MKNATQFLSVLSLAALLAACGDDTGGGGGAGGGGTGGHGEGGHHEEDLDVEACEHFGEGPFVDHTATDEVASAPDVSVEHTSHTIALIDFAGSKGGYVAFQAAEAGEYAFFFDADVPLSIQSSAGADVALEESCDPAACSASCDLVKGKHLVDLEVGTYYLELGPTALTEVRLVHEAAGAHDHDE